MLIAVIAVYFKNIYVMTDVVRKNVISKVYVLCPHACPVIADDGVHAQEGYSTSRWIPVTVFPFLARNGKGFAAANYSHAHNPFSGLAGASLASFERPGNEAGASYS